MYLVYRAQLPAKAHLAYDQEARKLLAKLLGLEPESFPKEFLHVDDSGHYLGGLSPYRLRAVQGCLELSAVGRAATETLATNAHRVTSVLSRYFRCPISETRRAGLCDLSEGTRINLYKIQALVFQRQPAQYRDLMARKDPQEAEQVVRELIEGRLRSGIERQANLLGIDVPYYVLDGVTFDEPVPVLVKERKFNLLARVAFRCSLVFHGPWHVGYLVSRGYGRIAAGR